MVQATSIRRRCHVRRPAQIVLTDQPGDWSRLVEQIVVLEELLAEASDGADEDASRSAATLSAMLRERRAALRELDVG